jgi:hypothetical protein
MYARRASAVSERQYLTSFAGVFKSAMDIRPRLTLGSAEGCLGPATPCAGLRFAFFPRAFVMGKLGN